MEPIRQQRENWAALVNLGVFNDRAGLTTTTAVTPQGQAFARAAIKS